jgi:hypothetical protein
MMERINACLGCGSKAEIRLEKNNGVDTYCITCTNCVRHSSLYKTKEEVIENWNKVNAWNEWNQVQTWNELLKLNNKKKEEKKINPCINLCLNCAHQAEIRLSNNMMLPYYISCMRCECFSGVCKTEEEAIERWNKKNIWNDGPGFNIKKKEEEEEEEINPCLRCGSDVEMNSHKDPEGNSHYYIRCVSDECYSGVFKSSKTRKEEIERWNELNNKKKEEYSKNDEDSELKISQNGGIIKCLSNFLRLSMRNKVTMESSCFLYEDLSFEGFLFKISLQEVQEIIDCNYSTGKFLELLEKLEEGWEIIMFNNDLLKSCSYILLGKPKLKN